MEPYERLRQARAGAGFKSAAQAAKSLGISYGTYSGHENGSRGIGLAEMRKYAELFGVVPAWLVLGIGSPETKDAPLPENKTERVQLLMTPSEVKAIDDWSFDNRIRGRAEAIRQLCALALTASKQDVAS